MKKLTIIFIIQIFCSQIMGQQTDKYLDSLFSKITDPPNCVRIYHESISMDTTILDSAYAKIIQLKKRAIPFLISKLSNTTDTNIFSQLFDRNFKNGDIALLLINDIESIPFAIITKIQWCICCDCTNFPIDFFNYFDTNRIQFYSGYKTYFFSKKQNRKLLVKTH